MARPTAIAGLSADTDLAIGLKRLLMGRLTDLLRYEDPLQQGDPDGRTGDDSPDASCDPDPTETVHDARVATRRLRAALALYPFSPDLRRSEMQAQVAALGGALGEVRDLDITLLWLSAHDRLGDEEEQAGIAHLIARKREQRHEQVRRLYDHVRRFYGGEADEMMTTLALLWTPRGRMGGKVMRQGLAQRLEKVGKWLDRSLAGKPDFVHELRIACKKLRYHAELLSSVVSQADGIVAALSPLQEGLGQLHDCDARLKWMPEYAAHAPRRDLPGAVLLLRLTYEERRLRWARMQEELLRWQEEDRLRAVGKGLSS